MDLGTDLNTHRTSCALIEDLVAHAPLYDFTVATRLLHKWIEQQHLPALKSRAHLSLAFPTADIQKIEQNSQQQFTLILNFLAIYGTTSPLPNYYTEEILAEMSQDNPVTRDFLNLFQQRLYEIYYDYYCSIQLNNETKKSRCYVQKIYALAGLGTSEIHSNIPSEKLLRYASFFSSKHRSYIGLVRLLSDYSNSVVEIDTYYLMQRVIPAKQHVFLGQKNCSLGEDCHMGQVYTSARNSLNIRFMQLTTHTFEQLLPGKPLALELKELIKLYILQSLHIHFELYGQLYQDAAPDGFCVLGQNAWLGLPDTPMSIAYQLS
jgi:type VI secretion system protein ImpH